MPTEGIALRRVRELLRLWLGAGLSLHEVACRTGVARSTLREMLGRFERSGLTWPLPLDVTDSDRELRFYGEASGRQGWRRKPEPDWATLATKLAGMTVRSFTSALQGCSTNSLSPMAITRSHVAQNTFATSSC